MGRQVSVVRNALARQAFDTFTHAGHVLRGRGMEAPRPFL
jgi:hypothetical protein